MLEALWRLYWNQFIKWTKLEDCEWRLDISQSSLEELYSEFDNIDVGGDKTRICDKFKVFRHFSLRNNLLVECGPLFTLSFKIVI